MQDKITLHCFVTGRVQGVFFRAMTQKEAEQLGLTGWVRNLPDGRVEVMACGTKEEVLKLHVWLKHGPPKAVVTDVTYEELPWCEHSWFRIM